MSYPPCPPWPIVSHTYLGWTLNGHPPSPPTNLPAVYDKLDLYLSRGNVPPMPTSLRRGLLKDLALVFQEACINHRPIIPVQERQVHRDKVNALHQEVLGLLRGIAYTERQHAITCEGMNKTIDSLVFQKATLEAARVAALQAAALNPATGFEFALGQEVTIQGLSPHSGKDGIVRAVRMSYYDVREAEYGVSITNQGGLYFFPSYKLKGT
jgi:hypothetical protein